MQLKENLNLSKVHIHQLFQFIYCAIKRKNRHADSEGFKRFQFIYCAIKRSIKNIKLKSRIVSFNSFTVQLKVEDIDIKCLNISRFQFIYCAIKSIDSESIVLSRVVRFNSFTVQLKV